MLLMYHYSINCLKALIGRVTDIPFQREGGICAETACSDIARKTPVSFHA